MYIIYRYIYKTIYHVMSSQPDILVFHHQNGPQDQARFNLCIICWSVLGVFSSIFFSLLLFFLFLFFLSSFLLSVTIFVIMQIFIYIYIYIFGNVSVHKSNPLKTVVFNTFC